MRARASARFVARCRASSVHCAALRRSRCFADSRPGLGGRCRDARDDESPAQADSNEHPVELPELASFGDVEGGRDLGDEGIIFDFYPNGSSSGGTIELRFELGRGRPISHTLSINPLISSISIEDEG